MWDVSNVTDFSYMFSAARLFNQDIGDWTTSATLMNHIFDGYTQSNPDIAKYDVSGTVIFNQDISRSHVVTYDNTER